MLKVYYWPMLARGAPLVRMLEHTGTPYEYISDPARFAEVCSNKGATGSQFAPPVIVDGDFVISQSTACTAYLGNKLGLTPPGWTPTRAIKEFTIRLSASRCSPRRRSPNPVISFGR